MLCLHSCIVSLSLTVLPNSPIQENPSDKEINQGTLVVFNLDPSVTNDNLLQIFGAYGEVKEVVFCLFPLHISTHACEKT